MMIPELFSQYKDIEIDFKGTNIELPNKLSVGQDLKNAEMNMTMNMVDRKVEKKESITTSAGTFDCFLITYTMEMKMSLKRIGKNKEWIAKGVGMVKSENYNKNGKLMGYSELTKISK